MHEASVASEIIYIVIEAAQRNNLRRIQKIQMCIGVFSCIQPELLQMAFEIVSQGTVAQNATLEWKWAAAEATYSQCQRIYQLKLLAEIPEKEVAVIEGDLYTDTDAQRIAALGVQTLQLNTRGACHLEAAMVEQALEEMCLEGVRYLVIDNIGNLVCTVEFHIGEDIRVAIISATKGNDKPLKYPLMFQTADVIVLNKIDLLPYLPFDKEQFWEDVRRIHPEVLAMETCALSGEGIAVLKDVLFETKKRK